VELEDAEDALMEMLAELPESGVSWDGGGIGNNREYRNGEVCRRN